MAMETEVLRSEEELTITNGVVERPGQVSLPRAAARGEGLRQWVRDGGHLVVAGTTNGQVVAARKLLVQRLAEKGFEPGFGLDHRLELGQIFPRSFELWLALFVREAEAHPRVPEYVPELAFALLGVHGDDYTAGKVRPHVGRQKFRVVAHKEGDPLAGSQSPGYEAGPEALGPCAKTAVRDILPLEAQAELLR